MQNDSCQMWGTRLQGDKTDFVCRKSGPLHASFKRREKTPHPQDKIQHLDFTKDWRPLCYKTLPCAFYHKNVRSKAVFGP